MTEMNDEIKNENMENTAADSSSYTAEYNRKPEKKSGFLKSAGKTAATAVLAFACGLGGGYTAITCFGTSAADQTAESSSQGISTAITTTTQTSPSTMKNGSSLTLAEAAAKAAPSVVEIQVKGTTQTYGFYGGTYETEAAGSGVIITEDGYIVTNNHVVEDGTTYTITTNTGETYSAELVGTDERTDIAVLKVDATGLTPATIADSDQIEVGDTAIAIGNPLGTLGGTVTDGIISATSRDIVISNEAMTLIQTNAQINSGNSGGGLFDGNGNLIGIVNAKDSGSTSSGTTIEGLGFAIPVNTAMDVADQLITYGEVTNRAFLGVQLQTVTRDTANYKAGLYIVGVNQNSGAELAGLQKYDRIISIEGTEVTSYTDLSAVLNKKHVGDVVTLRVERDGEEIDVEVTLGGSGTQAIEG